MKKSEILEIVAKAANLPIAEIVQKERAGRQIKANALFEGSSSPANPRSRVGVFFATDSPDLAIDGAIRRLSLDLPFPESIVILDTEKKSARVFGYSDSDVGIKVAKALNGTYEAVVRPAFASEAKPAGTLDSSHLEAELRGSPNVILQGPPGTGKSSIALELVRNYAARSEDLTSEQCRFGAILAKYSSFNEMLSDSSGIAFTAPIIWDMVQLHAGYAYEDLIRRITPVSKDGNLKFAVQDRLFPKLCALAAVRGPGAPVLLILDEINRCNLAATLGECVFAIDPGHRNTPVRLQYQGVGLDSSLKVPANLWIVGTMNTADRSIAMVDYAIRRRFRFIDVPANAAAIHSWYSSYPVQGALAAELFAAVNKDLKPAVMVSHSAFMIPATPIGNWAARMARQMAYHVIPLLIEYAREGERPPGPFHWAGKDFVLTEGNETADLLQGAIAERLSLEAS